MKRIRALGCVVLVFVIACQDPEPAKPPYGPPELILEANAGDQPGEIGITTGSDIGWPVDFAIDSSDNIWIMDVTNKEVHKFDPQGDYQLSFPNAESHSPLVLSTLYVECGIDGEIFVGPIQGSVIRINQRGEFEKQINLPKALSVIEFDFAVTTDGRIFYRNDEFVVGIDQDRKIKFSKITLGNVGGRNTTPWSRYHVTYNIWSQQYHIFNSADDTVQEDALDLKSATFSNSLRGVRHNVFYVEDMGDLFVRSRLEESNTHESITYHKAGGQLIQRLDLHPDIPRRLQSAYTFDRKGSLYVMEVSLPENVQTEENKPIHTDSPFVHIWKWPRNR